MAVMVIYWCRCKCQPGIYKAQLTLPLIYHISIVDNLAQNNSQLLEYSWDSETVLAKVPTYVNY